MTEKVTSLDQGQRPALTAPIRPRVIAALLNSHGVLVSPDALVASCEKIQANGASMHPAQRLSDILAHLGVRPVLVDQLQWDRLDTRVLPALVFLNKEWMYAAPGSEGQVCLTPPEKDAFTLAEKDLGQVPVLWIRRPVKGAGSKGRKAAGLILREIWQDKLWFTEVLAATIVINFLAVASSLFAMQVYDRVVPTFAYATLTALVGGMLIVITMDWALKFIRARVTDDLGRRVDQSMSQHLFDHVMHLRLDTRPASLGTLAAQMKGLEQVRHFFASTMIFFLTDMPFCIFFLFVIYLVGGQVALVYTVLLPLALAWGWIAQARLKKLSQKEIRKGHQRHGLLVEAIQGSETIQATGTAWRFSESWRQMTEAIAGYNFKTKSITSTAMTTTASFGTLGYVGALVIGVFCVERGELTTGGMIACAILGSRIINPVATGVRFMVQWQHVRESLDMVSRLLDLEKDRRQDRAALFPEALENTLLMDKVKFSYPGSPMICLDIPDLSLKAGDRVVILGPNGCGKSTLLKLMAGLFRPVQGQIRLGGVNLFDLSTRAVTEHVGYLPQDVHLFKGTLKTNMTLSHGISDADLISVAQLLGIDRIAASNPRSLELEIFENGQGLSGGQRQLAALARLFLARPRIWLLDEPSAALDLESENQVLAALKERARPTDIIVIATHRPRLATLANRVIIMGQGKLLRDGHPDDVINRQASRFARVLPKERRS